MNRRSRFVEPTIASRYEDDPSRSRHPSVTIMLISQPNPSIECEKLFSKTSGSVRRSYTCVERLIEDLTAAAGLPGNDDQAAMASLLTFHLLGLYPG